MAMASAQLNQLDDKQHMTELTRKQKAVVNALAEYPDKGPKEISEIASEALDGDTVSRSYVTPIKQKYGNLVEQQREIKENDRYEGEERTTGDPFDGALDNESGGWQTINDRPVKDTGESSERPQKPQETIQAELTQRDVEALLSGDVPEELKRELIVELVARAFERSDH